MTASAKSTRALNTKKRITDVLLFSRRYPPGIDYFRRLRSRLPGILSDSPDLLFQVQRDGSLVIWGIQHLSEEPRRIPKVVLVLRTPNALPAFICSSVCPDVCVFAERSVFGTFFLCVSLCVRES